MEVKKRKLQLKKETIAVLTGSRNGEGNGMNSNACPEMAYSEGYCEDCTEPYGLQTLSYGPIVSL